MPATLRLQNTDSDVAIAAGILAAGGIVAFPTETVYGLGADACNGLAVASIFAAKGRPSFNPLIIHVADLDTAQRFAIFTDVALKLAEAFWPGPLSLVLPVRAESGLSELVTAGLPTVAVRIPNHPLAKELLRSFGGALAAPSANPSGQISPTTAAHVINGLDGEIDAIIDGGACKIGVESTIVSGGKNVSLLRHGGISQDQIEAVLGHAVTAQFNADAPTAPGQLLSHYAPNAFVEMNRQKATETQFHLGFGSVVGDLNLSPSADLAEAASNLFAYLHIADDLSEKMGKKSIAVAPIPMIGLGVAINDRLDRAAAPRP